ncbi:MAG: PCI domain-containing protein [Candidatus Helarchaeota archaeon]
MEYKEQGRTLEVSGNFREAIESYLRAAVEIDKNLDVLDRKAEIGECLFRAAACFVELQEYPKAIKIYQNAINAFSESQLEIVDKYQNISNCCADIATCLLNSNPKFGVPNYTTAIKFFEKAREFTLKRAKLEESFLQKYILERAAIYNGFIALIYLFQEMPESAKEIIQKSDEIISKNKITGFGETFTNFIKNILESRFEEARQSLQIIEAESDNLSQSGPTFQAILIAALHSALTKYVPEERIHLTKVAIEEKGDVYLHFDSLRNIYLHTMFYANFEIKRSEWKESYGLLIGTIKGEDLIIAEAVPITSGEKYEVAFEEQHYSKAAEYDSLAVERGLFTVGWYHSHPGLGLFLSPTDILNQLGYQNLNPKAVALVFDFTKVSEKKLGFEIFRLDAPELGVHSDFHKVKWKIVDLKKHFEKEVPMIIENFITDIRKLINKSPKLSVEQIAQHLNYSRFVIKEILIELFQVKKAFPKFLFDIEAETLLNRETAYRAVLNLVKDYKEVSFSLISKTLNVTEKFSIKLIKDMLTKGYIQGKIREASADFVKN